MSLEQVIAEQTAALVENTAAIVKLTEAWLKLSTKANAINAHADAGGTGVVTAGGAPVAEVKADKPKATNPKAEPKPEAKPEPKAEAPVADYAPVGAAITAFAAANGREATLAKLEAFGVTSGKNLKPEQYADVLAAFTTTEEEVA